MTNSKIYGNKYQNDCPSNYYPQNLHLVWEDDLYGIYFVRSDNNKILEKTTDKMVTTETVETRTNANIARGYHDKDNHIIYLVDCDYDNGTSYVWSIDLSDDSVTELTTKEGDIFDIWRYDSETYILYFESSGYTLESDTIVPDGDVIANWNTSTGANHYTEIDEGTPPNVSDYIATVGADTDKFTMTTIDMTGYDSYNGGAGEQVYEITCYVYAYTPGLVELSVSGDQTGMSSKTMNISGAVAWYSKTWSGLSLTQAELTALEMTFTLSDPFSSGCTFYSTYCIVKFYGDSANANVVIENLDTSDQYSNDMGAMAGRSWYISQISNFDDQFWFNFKWSNENVELWKFDLSATSFTEMEDCGSGTELPSIVQGAIASDDVDVFYFVLEAGGTAEVSTIVADVPANIDDGDYITYSAIQRDEITGEYSEIDYYIWFDKVGDESGDPAPASKTKITVDISGAANAQDVSDAIQSAVDDVVLITCTNGGGTSTTCTLTCHHTGATTNIADVDSGLSVATTTPGVDPTAYLYSYEITDDTLTQLGTYNVALMLNRNSWTENYDSSYNYRPECFRYEKGFDLTTMKIYQIPRSYTGNLNYIANALRTQASNTIVAITDSYLIVNNSGTYELWEFVDLITNGQISEDIDIIHPEREYPDCVLQWAKKANSYFDPPTKDQWLMVFGRYTSNTITEAYYHDSGGFNEETIGTEGTSIAFVDSATLYDGELIIIESWQNHKNVLRLQDDATAAEDPTFTHNMTAATSGVREYYIGTNDITEEWYFGLYDTSAAEYIVLLRIYDSALDYYDSGDAWQEIQAVSNNTFYRIVIQWYADNTFDVTVDETLQVDGVACNNNQSSGIDQFTVYAEGDSTDYLYIDAFGDTSNSNYYLSKNRIKYDDDVIIFEGITQTHNRNILTDIKAISRATELDSISPKVSDYTNYTGKTSGQIVDQLIDDFCYYITPGTISNGSNTYTCPDDIEFKGDKTLRTIINELADGELFTWALRPTGELDFDDGSVSSYVQILATHNSKLHNPYVTILSEEYNQVIVYGGYVSGAKVGPYTYNNKESQQLHGILTWTKTYANQYDATILQTLANNKGALQGNSPLIWEAERDMGGVYEYGFIQPHETIYIEEGVLVGDDTDETITASEAGWYHLNVNHYDGLNDDSYLKLTDGLLFKENIQTTLPQQNSELIESLMGDGYATTEHTKLINPEWTFPQDGWTAGANNCYLVNGNLKHGASSRTNNSYLRCLFTLPDEYVDGEDFDLKYSWQTEGDVGGSSEETVDYYIRVFLQTDGSQQSEDQSFNSTWVGVDNYAENFETLTITGTNFSAGNNVLILIYIEDDDNNFVTVSNRIQLEIPVNERI